MSDPIGLALFAALVATLLIVDLAIAHRRPRTVSLCEAAVWSALWILVALGFGTVVWYRLGRQSGLEYFTGWLVEKALSIDNVFVFVALFTALRVPARFQHRVLFWGVLGALAMRGAMIGAGIALLERVHWLTYGLGTFLVATAARLARQPELTVHPERNFVLRVCRAWLPVTPGYHGARFFVCRPRPAATPLFVVLLLVETTDLVFAVDSVPVILAVTRDPFIVWTSNVFAVLGLRSLYFLVARAVGRLRYLRPGLALILGFVGVKLLASDVWAVPAAVSLAVTVAILAGAIAASLAFPHAKPRDGAQPGAR